MGRLFSALFLFLITGSALAANTSGALLDPTLHFAPPLTDYSVAYLSQIFGNVGNVLYGTSGQALGMLFEVFNKGVIVAATIWLGFNTGMIALRAAQEGSFLGQNKNVPVMFLRIALGFTLIIPSSSTGYSLLQDVFMKIVVAGVGLADTTWDMALNYIHYTGQIFIPPKNLNNDADVVSNAIGSYAQSGSNMTWSLGWMTHILQAQVCMYKSVPANSQFITPAPTIVPVDNSNPTDNTKGGYIEFPNYSTGSSNGCGTARMFVSQFSIKMSQQSMVQGEMNASSYSSAKQIQLAQDSFAALQQLVRQLTPIAKSYVPNSSNVLSDAEIEKLTFSALMGYVSGMTTYQSAVATAATSFQGNSQGSMSFINRAQAQGWIMAGRFYWDVEQVNTALQSNNISKMVPSVTGYLACKATQTTCWPVNFATPAINAQVNQYWVEYKGAQQNNVTNAIAQNAMSTGNSVADGAAAKGSDILNTAMNSFSSATGNYNPISILMQEGDNLLDASVGLWLGGMILTVALSAIAGICNSTSSGGLVLKTVITWLKSMMMMICFLLLVPGAILGYYVPMYPFAVYSFAAVGWILMIIEGMAAAPLVCMGLTHPEGHDFLGKAEQALMLFLSIFLRPALMVIGLIASMLVSFVAFKLILNGFQGLVENLSNSSGTAFGDGFLAIITQTMIMVIFGMITMELIEQSFKLIYQLPNNIMRWIGGPQMGEEYGQMASAIRGAVSGGAQGLQSAGEGGDKIASQANENIAAAKKVADENAAKKKDGSGSIAAKSKGDDGKA